MILQKIFSSHTFRFMVGYAAALSVAVFLVLAAIYATFSYSYFSDVHQSVNEQLQVLQNVYEQGGGEAVERFVEERYQSVPLNRFFYLVVDADGRRIAGNLDEWPRVRQYAGGWLAFELDALRRDDDALEAEFLARTTELPGGERLMTARHYGDVILSTKLVGGALLRSMIATIVLGTIGGAILAGLATKRIDLINRSLQRIMSGDLSERITIVDSRGDYRDLTINLNRMLDRIQSLMQGLRQVTDNVAHDLRTPLTRLRHQLSELEREVPAQAEGARELVRALQEEADSLLSTFNALLRIAQVESGHRRSGFADVDLRVILDDVIELYEPLAAEKDLALRAHLAPKTLLRGDRDLLFQALANLLDNAIKYTPPGGCIQVDMVEADGQVVVDVIDTGTGIPPADRDKVFRRFYRVESSRSEQPGNGLGLSLVQAVVQLHQGSISLHEQRPGLRVHVSLPLPG